MTGRGPFSLEENRRQIREFGIGVLVTKDSGHAGGTLEKLEAARSGGCRVVVVRRPVLAAVNVFSEIERMLEAMAGTIGGTGRRR